MVRWAGAWLGLQQAVPISWSLARAVSSIFPFIVIALTDRFLFLFLVYVTPKGQGVWTLLFCISGFYHSVQDLSLRTHIGFEALLQAQSSVYK